MMTVDEKVATEWDLMEWEDAIDAAEKRKSRDTTVNSLVVFIKAQGVDHEKSKFLIKKDARDPRPYRCEASFFTFKINQ